MSSRMIPILQHFHTRLMEFQGVSHASWHGFFFARKKKSQPINNFENICKDFLQEKISTH